MMDGWVVGRWVNGLLMDGGWIVDGWWIDIGWMNGWWMVKSLTHTPSKNPTKLYDHDAMCIIYGVVIRGACIPHLGLDEPLW